ncbi:endonuclease/exonuclease/phosphatase family protein [Adhaeretor mobilis]|uniref:Endonuclease/Exonuclease/phosphatase family protein n=1 Tax=Adhaeretor mobilis TaxID=1930276 RepID=A0A517N2C0_9BACT|nr:endonuclease/exonuclease/phosphatase family protein [Adhaeretor mobilis]QDT01286.1 Endonuclease/Exonuclease/phosphatase family protein [Adhaeretor mobilis]
MQRLLSLGTLGVLGGLVWVFLTGGGLEDMAGAARDAQNAGVQDPSRPYSNQHTQDSYPQQDYPQQGSWTEGQTPPLQPAPPVYQQPSTPSPPIYRPASSGSGGSIPRVDEGPTIKIASFNIQVFGKAKVEKANGAVIRTLAEIVRQFDVVAIQEIRTSDDYHIPNFVRLINSGGAQYDHVTGPRIGNTRSTEQYAFIFDTRKIMVDRSSVYTLSDPDNVLHREPLVAHFQTRLNPDSAFSFTLVNIHTDPDEADEEVDAMADVYRVVRRAGGNEDDVIALGDWNADDRDLASSRLGQIPGVYPLIKGVFTNTRQTKLYDNLVIHQPSTTEYTGRSGVFDMVRQFNITQEQALMVSDHLPVWAEFSAYERDYSGQVASRSRQQAQYRR